MLDFDPDAMKSHRRYMTEMNGFARTSTPLSATRGVFGEFMT